MRKLAVAIMSVAVLMSLAVPSSAAPDRSITLSPQVQKASWSGATNVGTILSAFPVLDPQTRCLLGCDDTLVRLTKPGTLRLDITATGLLTSPDFSYLELTVYRSDAAGTKGQALGSAASKPGASVTVRKAVPGYYLAEVAWRDGVNGYDGRATFTPVKSR